MTRPILDHRKAYDDACGSLKDRNFELEGGSRSDAVERAIKVNLEAQAQQAVAAERAKYAPLVKAHREWVEAHCEFAILHIPEAILHIPEGEWSAEAQQKHHRLKMAELALVSLATTEEG